MMCYAKLSIIKIYQKLIPLNNLILIILDLSKSLESIIVMMILLDLMISQKSHSYHKKKDIFEQI